MFADWFVDYVTALAAAESQAGLAVHLVLRDHGYEFAAGSDDHANALARARRTGVDVGQLPGKHLDPRSWPGAVRAVRHLRSRHPDVVHVQQNADPRMLGLSRVTPMVLTLHEPAPRPGVAPASRRTRAVEAAWRRAADAIVVLTPPRQQRLPGVPATTPIHVLPHGADIAAKPPPVPNEPVVLGFGNLEPYKRVPDLLAAMAIVWRTLPRTRLVIMGDGADAPMVAAAAARDSRIEFHRGRFTEEELAQALARATVAALPYASAAGSGVASKAAGFGVPVVVTRTGSLADFTLDPSLTANLMDPPSFAAALLAGLETDLSYRDALLDHLRTTISWPVVARLHSEVYESVAPQG